jgi:endogenous inhibitor of DNA gyrase (YacG/DUF329 family)
MTESKSNGTASARLGACPICGKPAAREMRPFCSKRCADVDLHRWLSGAYSIPVKDEEDEDGTAPERPRRDEDSDER